MNRRVSFAPSAHVRSVHFTVGVSVTMLICRMFEVSAQSTRGRRSSVQPGHVLPPPPVQQAAPSGPRPSNATHGRRSSIQQKPVVTDFEDEGGEVSMDIEESDGEDQGGIRYSAPTAQDTDEESDDGEGEMSMEETQVYSGQIVSHQSYTGDESFVSESDANTSTRSDEEKTMDFTVAIGGFLPPAPPVGATRGRASVGYSHVNRADAEVINPGEGDDMDMEMNETVAFGGIINLGPGHGYAHGQDDTISTASGSEDTMTMNRPDGRTATYSFNNNDLASAAREEQSAMGLDMTVGMDLTTVAGGIFSQSYQQHQAAQTHALSRSQSQTQQGPSITPKSPRVTSITRPSGGTPSFARPTTSSASKVVSLQKSPEKTKRNIFGPSPSPFKATPRKSGMQTAGEVAKRLSFGSAAGSTPKKRIREESPVEGGDAGSKENTPPSAKKQRLSVPTALGLGESVFGNISRAPPAPVSSPIRVSPAVPVANTSTPSRSPAVRRAMGITAPLVEDEEEEEVGVDLDVNGEPRTVGLGAFLTMAGVQFDDSAPSGSRRRRSVAKGLLGKSQSRSSLFS